MQDMYMVQSIRYKYKYGCVGRIRNIVDRYRYNIIYIYMISDYKIQIRIQIHSHDMEYGIQNAYLFTSTKHTYIPYILQVAQFLTYTRMGTQGGLFMLNSSIQFMQGVYLKKFQPIGKLRVYPLSIGQNTPINLLPITRSHFFVKDQQITSQVNGGAPSLSCRQVCGQVWNL